MIPDFRFDVGGKNQLDRDKAVQIDVLGLPDDAHAAAAKLLNQLIAAEQLAGERFLARHGAGDRLVAAGLRRVGVGVTRENAARRIVGQMGRLAQIVLHRLRQRRLGHTGRGHAGRGHTGRRRGIRCAVALRGHFAPRLEQPAERIGDLGESPRIFVRS